MEAGVNSDEMPTDMPLLTTSCCIPPCLAHYDEVHLGLLFGHHRPSHFTTTSGGASRL